LRRNTEVEEIKVVGLRRRIAEKMALAKARIPHITYVEEIDVTALEELRARLNAEKAGRPAAADRPALPDAGDGQGDRRAAGVNAHLRRRGRRDPSPRRGAYRHRHPDRCRADGAGRAPCGSARSVGLRPEVNRLAEAAKAGTATREELTGSTITITSLGALGGVVTTPVINHPEVAIVGVNKMAVRPVWDGQQFVPRKMMNLSSSFDHRVIDGWNAAVFVQRIKTLLETPAMIFLED
jgi:2-oxoisovalerate dehydrogenase E2 component (dihydrolipoyl transacylase)